MTAYRVIISPMAKRQILRIGAWWLDNRQASSSLFDDELNAAILRAAEAPHAGANYPARSATKRVVLPKTRCALYYSVDEEHRLIRIRSVWHTSRGRGPRL